MKPLTTIVLVGVMTATQISEASHHVVEVGGEGHGEGQARELLVWRMEGTGR